MQQYQDPFHIVSPYLASNGQFILQFPYLLPIPISMPLPAPIRMPDFQQALSPCKEVKKEEDLLEQPSSDLKADEHPELLDPLRQTNLKGNKRSLQKTPKQEIKLEEEAKATELNKDLKETKNISKNFSRAIIAFILNSAELASRFFSGDQDQDRYFKYLKKQKKKQNSIKAFSNIIKSTYQNKKIHKFNEVTRLMGISQTSWHLKYRRKVMKAFHHPEDFTQLKHL